MKQKNIARCPAIRIATPYTAKLVKATLGRKRKKKFGPKFKPP